jgi:NAD(P)-dependent dehydrogenase (short-subunit alcohol dehydrogenase family)
VSDLEGKVAIVTGGAGGIGFGIAEEFLRQRASVVICDTNEATLAAARAKLKGPVEAVQADVSVKRQVAGVVEAALARFKKIDILVNNAGGSQHTPYDLDVIEETHWDLVVDVNLKGTFFFCQAVAGHMKERRQGRIVNVASIAGRNGGLFTGVHYAAAKGGVIALTRNLARSLGPFNITVNAIAPGLTVTGDRIRKLMQDRDAAKSLSGVIPLGRYAETSEQASVVAFLASEASSYVNGSVIDVNGGSYMA